MNDFNNIIDTCINTPYCQKCRYYDHDTGDCVFDGMPRAWEIEKINALFETAKPAKKRGVK